MFIAFITGELIRYAVTNSKESDFKQICDVFWQRLLARGYPSSFMKPIFAGVKHADRHQYLQRPTANSSSTAPVLVVTNGQYEQQRMRLGRVVNAVYEKYKASIPEPADLFGDRVAVAYRNPPTLGKLLVNAKH